ncbi:neuronal acetylcholine receptor subunit alpha-10-like [Acanthaster planci]|uniref:Neuronal acetylcholine receptor subunit alpha-10-like n=1 Tax=Acanthaster planci TaxID=133434 RepID=A0A8B7YH15_ACAPL|nr:neuronal acetylcholine receptor subunit alpha-10-like [Acanthaster planci]
MIGSSGFQTSISSVVLAFLLLLNTKGLFASEPHRQLRHDLLYNSSVYDTSIRPVKNDSHPTVVEMQFFVAQVLDVDERLETFKINAWLTMRWKDEYLVWNPSNYNGLRNFKISKEKLWMPDLWLYNNAGSRYEDYAKNSICSVYYDGTVVWQSPSIIKTHCQMDVTNFPFDRQTCSVQFGPWQHGADEIILEGTGSADRYLRSSGEWSLMHFNASNGVEGYQIYPDDPEVMFTFVTYSVELRRIPTYFVFYLIMPCVLIACTTLLSFFLPAESGEKVSLSITVLLSLTVFLLLVAELLPPSGAVPIIAIYYASTMVMVSLSLAMSVVVLNLHHMGPAPQPVPQWLRRLIFSKFGRLILMRKLATLNQKLDSKNNNGCAGKRRHKRPLRKLFANVELKGTFENDHVVGTTVSVDGNSSSSGNERETRKRRCPLGQHMRAVSTPAIPSYPEDSSQQMTMLRQILDEFKCIRETFEAREREETMRAEWKQVALVIDRIFMVLYVIGMLATLFIIIGHIT